MWLELLKEFYYDLMAHKTRAFLTILAIIWGTVAVVLLMAFGKGMGNRFEAGTVNSGNGIMMFFDGQTSMVYNGLAIGRQIHMYEEDVRILKTAIPEIDMISPQYTREVALHYKSVTVTTNCEGVNALFEEMRMMYPIAGGRFLNGPDVTGQRRVLFIGSEIAKELFGEEDPIGKPIDIDGVPFTVVGLMQPKMQTSMNNGPDKRRAIIPYTTYRTLYGEPYVNTIVVRPFDPAQHTHIVQETRRILGRKYGFDPADERAIDVWDMIEESKMMGAINIGMALFLGSIGFLTLLIAGVGVANVMYIVVKERTREIGIKMAIGARRSYILWQFVFESLLISFLGGGIGLTFSWLVITGVRMIPFDPNEMGPMQFMGRPILDVNLMLMTIGVLAAIGLLAGIFPARRAAAMDPVESLRYE